ncbi:MAG: hypothetical protein GY849_23925 [Deltaproteobacteria bacterium]|nr:hypothetical protein [Deltaproteobacteria bacterium]
MKERNVNKEDFPKAVTCSGKIEVPTEKEREALGAMKAIKERVRDVKERLRLLHASEGNESAEEGIELEEELAKLKIDWDMWEEKRRKAAKERMIILGHEKGD